LIRDIREQSDELQLRVYLEAAAMAICGLFVVMLSYSTMQEAGWVGPPSGCDAADRLLGNWVHSGEKALPVMNKLRVLRAERNWSQAELAQQLKVSRQTVNAIETGKYDPSLPLAFDLAKLFGLKIEEIFQHKA